MRTRSSYVDDMAHLPTAEWIAESSAASGEPVASFRIRDADSGLEAVSAGLGKTLLPEIIAENCENFVRMSGQQPELSREVWLLTHSNQTRARRIVVGGYYHCHTFKITPKSLKQ